MTEYKKWLDDNHFDDVKTLTDLNNLPPLPKCGIDESRRNIFCCIRKTFIPRMAMELKAGCPLGLWPPA